MSKNEPWIYVHPELKALSDLCYKYADYALTEDEINILMESIVLALVALNIDPLSSIPATYWHLCDEEKIAFKSD